MKYHVYAALIATTQAGPIAEAFEKNMPTPEETEYAEAKLNRWADTAENITKTAKPIIKNRNEKIMKAWNNAGEEAKAELMKAGDELEGQVKRLDKKLTQIDQYAMEDLEAAGILDDEAKLKAKIEKDLKACQKSMFEVRQATMSLKGMRFDAQEFHDAMPTKEQVAEVEETVDGWIIRGEDLKDRAIPSIKERNNRIKAAWQTMEKEDEKVTLELIDKLEKAQMDFVEDLDRANKRLERTLESNGTFDDMNDLEKQIEADLKKMEQMHSVVMKMNPHVAHKIVENEVKKDIARKHVAGKVVEHEVKKDIARKHVTKKAVEKEIVKNEVRKANRAANRLSNNLASVSEEMEKDSLTAEEWEAKKSMVISWVSDFEDIMAKAEPIAKAREQDIEYELEAFGEDFEDLAEKTVKELEKTDREFTVTHDQANEDMVHQLKLSGAVDQFKDLAEDIDNTLSEMERCMSKVKRSASLIKRFNKQRNAQSLGKIADAMKEEIPTGKQVAEVEGYVTGWAKKGEAIEKKAEPALKRREKQVEDAAVNTYEFVEENAIRAFNEFEKNDMDFLNKVETAEYDMLDSWENTGITADAKKLGGDIEAQFNTWEKNMARRAPVQSLTAQQSKTVSQNLRSLEADLDMVLKSM